MTKDRKTKEKEFIETLTWFDADDRTEELKNK